ncbi:uncharacterized protein LOC124354627 isoform X1 [Homalodisca vitripennis]|uniref:uncharacterized protein LOC124354627 isoform X1 n=1 Tax=Homalodisca vitripennis TaxID=197043 RepID=UPI001EEB05D2|nr:uncharacterized protein LOC124354627 isoform X1 [Homalodisca vitripennis]
MATRKLKFKPKPVIGGGSVRKTKEKDDVPELAAKASIISDKEDLSDKNIENSSITENIHIESNSEEKVLKKLKTDDGSCVSRLEDVQHESNTSQHQDSQSGAPTSSQCIPNNITFEQQRLVPTDLIVESDQVTTVSSDCNDSHKTKPPQAAEVETVIVINDSLPAKDTGNCTKSSKPDSVKGLPRFGRSRCKPILTNPGLRKKNDVKTSTENVSVSLNNGFIKSMDGNPIVSKNEQSSSGNVSVIAEDNVDVSGVNSLKPCESVSVIPQVRTESVIKNLRTELTKNGSVVNEIKDNISSIESNVVVDVKESNKIVPPQISLSKDCETVSVESESGCKSSFHILPNISSKGGNSVVKKQIVSAQTELNSISENSVIVINLSNTALSSDCSLNKSEQESEMKVDLPNTNNISHKLPLSPLKPISKVLVPKPSPRISDIAQRRISFQGSDSEDESKRKPSQSSCDITKTYTKEKKEKVLKKESKRRRSQGSTYSKMGQETMEKLNKRFGKHQSPDKTKLTMLDFIFYNPKNNPMTEKTDNASSGKKKKDKEEVIGEALDETLAEQQVDDVEAPSAPSAIPVPQLKVGPDGQIILDPKSLVIETTGMEKSRAELENSQVVQETGATRYNTYSKRKAKRHEWTARETVQFYKALHTVGSDFAIMTKLFPKRSRHELKLKFKREERINLNLVDKAMTAPADFDFTNLEEELREENDQIEKKKIAKKMAAEAAKRERALKKEEKEKSKNKQNKNNNKNNKNVIKGQAFREINEADQGINPNISVSIKKM